MDTMKVKNEKSVSTLQREGMQEDMRGLRTNLLSFWTVIHDSSETQIFAMTIISFCKNKSN